MRRTSPLLLAAALLAPACQCPSAPAPPPASLPASGRLHDFVGSFAGELRLLGHDDAPPVPMRLDVTPLPADEHGLRWLLRYGDHDERDYRLRIDDAATGRCTFDERNGILLAAWFGDSELVSVFRAADQWLDCRYRCTPAGIEFALEAVDTTLAEVTGQQVTTFPRVVRQRALLRRAASP